jgi:hypothetical protein
MMLSGFPQQMGTKSERKLCKLYSSLNDNDRLTLMKFAEFLLAESTSQDEISEGEGISNGSSLAALTPFPEPKVIPAPENENVIKAIKRIAKMYYMVDKSKMLDTTSTLMTEHLIHGRPAQEIVADVEKSFKQEYDKLYSEYSKKQNL